MASRISENQIEDDCSNCRSRRICGTELFECLERSECSRGVDFGYSRFCKKPYAAQMNGAIVNSPLQIAHESVV
jgi:hypothetical protein